VRRGAVIFSLAVLAGLTAGSSASASGSCGNDFSPKTACPVTSPGTYHGSLAADNEYDFYVFYGHQGTHLQVAITDNEDPSCSTGDFYSCGFIHASLTDVYGDVIDTTSPDSQPQDGAAVTGTMNETLDSTGAYYLQIDGLTGQGDTGPNWPIPYTMTVTASPGVHWPPVKVKQCTVTYKNVRKHHKLVRVKVTTCRYVYT
jgi:hypothetical protein